MAKRNSQEERLLRQVQTACMFVIAAVALGAACFWLADLLIPLILALFLAMALRPLTLVLRDKLRIPHGLAVVLTFLLGFGVLFGLGVILATAIADIASNSGLYVERFKLLRDDLIAALPLESLGMSVGEVSAKVASATDGMSEVMAGMIVSALGTLFGQGSMVMLYLIFMMLGESVRAPEKTPSGSISNEIAAQVQSYILVKIGLSFGTALFSYIVLMIAGVELALVFALLTFMLNFIPNIGSVIAMVLPLPLMLVDASMTPATIITTLSILGAGQFAIGNFVEPKMLGKSMDLHPVAVLFALVFFAKIWGIVGALLATPLLGVSKILLMRSEYTKRLGDLLSEGKEEDPDGDGDKAKEKGKLSSIIGMIKTKKQETESSGDESPDEKPSEN